MKFGPVNVEDAVGAILAHSVGLNGGKRLKKGILLDADNINQLKRSDIDIVIVAQLSGDDVHEDDAARQIGEQLCPQFVRMDEARTGRVNFFATTSGVFRTSAELVNAINAIDPAITFATLDDYTQVNEGRMIATIKIIPYAVSAQVCAAIAAMDVGRSIQLHPFSAKKIGLIATTLSSVKPSVMDKTRSTLEQRLGLSGSAIVAEKRVVHHETGVCEAIQAIENECDIIILFGASAISDRHDVIPLAIEQAGGTIKRFGMPVDPGNLLLLAELNGKPVIGAPGCARSPAENGFDWVLQRLLADIPVSASDLSGMGVGGLLMETGARPHPREKKRNSGPGIAAIVLAAGQSRRMGRINKLTAVLDDKPIVRHVAEAALASRTDDICVVTGHEDKQVIAVLSDLNIAGIHNPDFEEGLSSSLACGIAALNANIDRAIVLLGDMPFITPAMIDRMIETAISSPENSIIVATHAGKRGNPVLWPRSFFGELQSIKGDVGARHIIGANPANVVGSGTWRSRLT